MNQIPRPIPKLGLYLYTQAAQEIAEIEGLTTKESAGLWLEMAHAIRQKQLVTRRPIKGTPKFTGSEGGATPYVLPIDINTWLEKQGYSYEWDPKPTPQSSAPISIQGEPRKRILAITWPLRQPFNQKSLDRALSDTPKWLLPALMAKGAPGKGSSLWNLSLIAVSLLGKKHANAKALTSMITKYFPEWLPEWENARELHESGNTGTFSDKTAGIRGRTRV